MDNSLDFLFRPLVMVTGFGPFANHPVNASWEAVKLMNKEELEKKHNIDLVLLEIPVTYENVDEFVPALWETHTPKLMIHVGVSKQAQELTLEKQAHRKGYQRLDYLEKCPANHVCRTEGAVRLHTKLDVDRICQEFNDGNPVDTTAVASLDAGSGPSQPALPYYKSLSIDNTCTLFVHVPDMEIYSPERTALALERVLGLCLNQLSERGDGDAKELADKLKGSVINDED